MRSKENSPEGNSKFSKNILLHRHVMNGISSAFLFSKMNQQNFQNSATIVRIIILTIERIKITFLHLLSQRRNLFFISPNRKDPQKST